jgi:glutamyl-tRNA reductase
MKLQMIGCSHHTADIALRERLAFAPDQLSEALTKLRSRFPESEAVLLSTCNRVELYLAASNAAECPTHRDVVEFVATFHGLEPVDLFEELFERTGEDAVRHLFSVAASLDSMVIGEAQILSQVKQAYEVATAGNHAGTLLNLAFQRAIHVARRVANETAINQKRVSIPSVAVADFACQIFERFDDKRVLVAGAEETLRYLWDQGIRQITIINRSFPRAQELAREISAKAEPWEKFHELLSKSDLVVSATGATEPIIRAQEFAPIEQKRNQRPLFVLDLAVPRSFDPAIGDFPGVYLYSIDDLSAACERNRQARQRELPRATRIIEDETRRFMTELHHRATGPTIRRLKARAEQIKADELQRLFNKLNSLDPRTRGEIEQACDRIVSKILHPPLETLRAEAEAGTPHGLLDALKRLFGLKD